MRQCDSYSTSMQMRCCYAEGHSGEHHFSNHDETDRIRWKFAADERDRLIAENDSLRAEVERLRKLRDIIERLAQFNEEEAKAWILSEYGARKAGAAVVLRSVLREFDSIGKDGGNG